MSFSLISNAYADTATAGAATAQNSMFSTMAMVAIFLVAFYFLLIRPQSKRNKEHQNLMNNLQKGDEIITSGGIMGKIVKIDENIVTLALNDTTEIKLQKNAVVGVLPKGTVK